MEAANPEMPSLSLGFSLESPQQRWRNVLAQSNKEMLQELLSSAASAEPGRSIEEIAFTVADRILASEPVQNLLETESALSPLVKPMHTEDLLKGPQLEDIQVTEWNIWSGKVKDAKQAEEELRKSSKCSPHGGRSVVDFELRELEHNVPEQVGCASDDESFRNRMHAGLELRTTTQQYTWMRWEGKPRAVLLVAKQGDREVTRKLRDIASWIDSQGVYVVLEPELWDEVQGRSPGLKPEPSPRKVCWCAGPCDCRRLVSKVKRQETPTATPKWQWGSPDGLPPGFAQRCRTWTPYQDKLEEHIDLVISLGGDGTLCWTSGLFAGAMPPVIAFAAGSLGFLTPFPLSDWMSVLMPILGSKSEVAPALQLVCRMRFQMRLSRHEEDDATTSPAIPVQSMNEVLVHRGASPHLVKLDVCVNDKSVTMVQGDGLIIATPTGSTAYSLAAGGSMMHPAVPGIILTPVCPHSLSFRPVVLPDSAVVKVRVPTSARTSRVMVAVDGKDRIELKRGDSIEVAVSPYPLPTICRSSVTKDWFRSVNEALQWNLRLEQKAINKS
ncbi:NADK2 [Symbiodinium pilosum]|uniref:NADK2 protein n=1 Tax=Symbiodinium pilosum TaxID=2952 RepID=A0A812WUV6_SYMPI|nr:NADK2 [Symbiodinium pilosum]